MYVWRMKALKAVITSGRDFQDIGIFTRTMYGYHQQYDFHHLYYRQMFAAGRWVPVFAKDAMVPYTCVKPNWPKHGVKAATLCNLDMLKTFDIDVVIGFEGGSGMKDIWYNCTMLGIPFLHINQDMKVFRHQMRGLGIKNCPKIPHNVMRKFSLA